MDANFGGNNSTLPHIDRSIASLDEQREGNRNPHSRWTRLLLNDNNEDDQDDQPQPQVGVRQRATALKCYNGGKKHEIEEELGGLDHLRVAKIVGVMSPTRLDSILEDEDKNQNPQ